MDVLYIYVHFFYLLKIKPDKIAISLKFVVTMHSGSPVETSECIRLLKTGSEGR